jgi:hypothetical protein
MEGDGDGSAAEAAAAAASARPPDAAAPSGAAAPREQESSQDWALADIRWCPYEMARASWRVRRREAAARGCTS